MTQDVTPTSGPDGAEPLRDADPFSPEALRVAPDAGAVGVRPEVLVVPVRKPGKQEWFRVRPGEGWRLPMLTIELREERETYAVAPAMAEELAAEGRLVLVYTCLSRGGALFLWSVPLPGPDGKRNQWHESAHAIAERATERWVRAVADQAAGMYQPMVAPAQPAEPTWPDIGFGDALRLAFRERLIDSVDYPVVRRLA